MILFDHLTKGFGEGLLYSDFTGEWKDGEFVVVTGKSGRGKTTLIRMLLKETEPDSGRIIVGGQDLSQIDRGMLPYYRRRIGVIFQDFRLIGELSVYDNLAAAIYATGGGRRDAERKIAHVLSMLGIDHLHKRMPSEMSGGEQQKVCLARAIVNNPMVLLADEPTGNLDPISTRELLGLMGLVHSQGVTVVLATHDRSVAAGFSTRHVDLDTVANNHDGGGRCL